MTLRDEELVTANLRKLSSYAPRFRGMSYDKGRGRRGVPSGVAAGFSAAAMIAIVVGGVVLGQQWDRGDTGTPPTASTGEVPQERDVETFELAAVQDWPSASAATCEAVQRPPGDVVLFVQDLTFACVHDAPHRKTTVFMAPYKAEGMLDHTWDGSLYKCLDRGGVDAEAMRDLLVAHRPPGWPLVFAVDESTWARCDAETSPQRGFYYSASTHSAGQPIVAGWSYQWITGLDWACDSWTAPIDAVRIPPGVDAVQATLTQIRDLTDRLERTGPDGQVPVGQVPVFAFDAGYDPIALTHELADVRACLVVRIRDDRVFYTDPLIPRPRHHRTAATARRPPRLRRTRHLAGTRHQPAQQR